MYLPPLSTQTRARLFACLFLLLPFSLLAQSKVTLSGYLRDARNGEALIGASVFVQELNTGATSNPYGFYSISVPAGKYKVAFSYVGYTKTVRELDLTTSQQLNIELLDTSSELEEVVVSANRDANVKAIEMSVQRLDIGTINKLPALLGEVDIVKSIQLLPGVTSAGEGATGFNVRGGDVGQNLILLDEAPVFNSSHLFGFFSVFNPDVVKDVKLLKGGIPAQYGGRLASILDVRMDEGNSKKFSAQGGLGLIFSRLTLSAPIIEDKVSVMVAARRSYIDILAKPFLDAELKNSRFNFYDLTAKVNARLSNKDQIFLSTYLGRDVFNANNQFDSNWGNKTATLRWTHLFSDKLFMNSTVYGSDYDYRLAFAQNKETFEWEARIRTASFKPEFTYYLNNKNTLTFGGQGIVYEFQPGTTRAAISTGTGDAQQAPAFSIENKYGLESAVYVANEQNIGSRLSLQYGLRYSWFTYMGSGTTYEFNPAEPNKRREPIAGSERTYGMWDAIKTYGNLEPRLSLKVDLTDQSSVKASYNRMAQYIHLISNTSASTPLDIWMPSTNNLRPELADQFAVGYFRNFKDNTWETSVELYYKDMRQQVEYIDGADLRLNQYLEGDLMEADGRAYGAEFLVRKNGGKVNGWASYTLGRSERRTQGINQNEWYPTRFDQTHNLKAVLFYEPSKKWNFSTNFTLISGTPTTFFNAQAEIGPWGVPHNPDNLRNNQRIPTYHRLDVSATYTPSKNAGRKWQSYWVFSLYNLYNRKNPYSIYFQPNPNRPADGVPAQNEAIQFSVIGTVIPSVSYNFKF